MNHIETPRGGRVGRVGRVVVACAASVVFLLAACGDSASDGGASATSAVSTVQSSLPPVNSSDSSPSSSSPTSEAPTSSEAPSGASVEVVEGTEFAADGDVTVTVKGSGFTDLAFGSRPPLSDMPAGVYIVFGTFDDVWQPSAGAPIGARRVAEGAQVWAMPVASREAVDPDSLLPDVIVLDDDGTFTAQLTISAAAVSTNTAGGTVAIAVYPAGGAMNAAHEFLIPIVFTG